MPKTTRSGSAKKSELPGSDGTAEYGPSRASCDRLPAFDENLGAVARNHAVALVTTPYVAYCDDSPKIPSHRKWRYVS